MWTQTLVCLYTTAYEVHGLMGSLSLATKYCTKIVKRRSSPRTENMVPGFLKVNIADWTKTIKALAGLIYLLRISAHFLNTLKQ